MQEPVEQDRMLHPRYKSKYFLVLDIIFFNSLLQCFLKYIFLSY